VKVTLIVAPADRDGAEAMRALIGAEVSVEVSRR
jgi:hypothetical protein